MAVVIPGIPQLTAADLDLFSTTDPLLCNAPIIVFYGEHMTALVSASSRIQLHVYTPGGFESYPRLSVTPTSPYYASVKALPREEQGDEVCRGIAFGLAKYFAELPQDIKESWLSHVFPTKRAPAAQSLFSPTHVAVLASRMTRVERIQPVIDQLYRSLGRHRISWLDIDVVLPLASIKPQDSIARSDAMTEEDETRARYGKYHFILSALGERTFLPTSKVKRAPSKPTTLGRSALFTREQKELVRKEMCELVDTEENYVQKLSILIDDVATSIRHEAREADAALVKSLFPDSLDSIVKLNTSLLDTLRHVLDTTEEAALADLEEGAIASLDAPEDSIGLVPFATALLSHLPNFGEDYAHFMAGHAKYPELIKTILKGTHDSTIRDIVHKFGEQRLASILIEPVQRLPRYSLYIDTITKQLSLRHPALPLLLKARDIVTDICLRDEADRVPPLLETRLAFLVQTWPIDAPHLGRLVAAADASRMRPPFAGDASDRSSFICLLCTNALVILEKLDNGVQSARSLQTELHNLTVVDPAHLTASQAASSLRLVTIFDIQNATVTECLDDQAIAITQRRSSDVMPAQPPLVLCLQGSYANKVSRFVEELAKARVEGRFTDAEREDRRWDVRSAIFAQDEVNLLSAIFDAGDEQRDQVAALRLVVDADRNAALTVPGQKGLDISISVASLPDGSWQLGVKDKTGVIARDRVAEADFANVLIKRMSSLLLSRSTIKDPAMMPSLIAQNDQILKSLSVSAPASSIAKYAIPLPSISEPPERYHRPHSPVKTISTFLSSIGPGGVHGGARKSPAPETSPQSQTGKAMSVESRQSKEPTPISGQPGSRNGSVVPEEGVKQRLVDTLLAYHSALQARKGNIVAKVINARGNADRKVVESLYNTLLREPGMMMIAGEVSVDVLLSSFERFLRGPWTEQFGPIVPVDILKAIRSKGDTTSPSEFERYLSTSVADLTVANQKALKNIIRLLAELLDGTDNDGDRGALTVVFAELLVHDDDPHAFVSLIDRFVREVDILFADPAPEPEVDCRPKPAMVATEQAKPVHYGSLNTKTSSLRTKLGFGSTARDNSMRENHRPGLDKVGSVWRTISKSTNPPEASAVMTRATVQRAKSTDLDTRILPKRTISQEKKLNALGDFSWERSRAKDHNFMHTSPLSTIGESGKGHSARAKRRSSLSDVPTPSKIDASLQSPPGVKRLNAFHAPGNDQNATAGASPRPRPSSAANRLSMIDASFPTRLPSIRRGASPSKHTKQDAGGIEATQTFLRDSSMKPDEVTITMSTPSKRPNAPRRTSSIDTSRTSAVPVRAGLSGKPTSGNATRAKTVTSPGKGNGPKGSPSPTRKLKVQSPQKLRERLQQEQKAVTVEQSTLQEEITKLGDELNQSPRRDSSIAENAGLDEMAQFRARLARLQETLDKTMIELNARTAAMQVDFASSLTVSENRSKSLDALYREANAENEALYARFNDELSKVVKAVRSGEGVAELKRAVKDGCQERDTLRRENARLKREVVGLRCQLRD